eukprot:c49168_g1_i1 orf=3-191(-)
MFPSRPLPLSVVLLIALNALQSDDLQDQQQGSKGSKPSKSSKLWRYSIFREKEKPLDSSQRGT